MLLDALDPEFFGNRESPVPNKTWPLVQLLSANLLASSSVMKRSGPVKGNVHIMQCGLPIIAFNVLVPIFSRVVIRERISEGDSGPVTNSDERLLYIVPPDVSAQMMLIQLTPACIEVPKSPEPPHPTSQHTPQLFQRYALLTYGTACPGAQVH